jgi:uncharacterized membrane protein YfcA
MDSLSADPVIPLSWFAVGLIAFFANYLKGVIGTGTGTVMMATSTLFIEPKLAVVVISYISVFSSLMMIRIPAAPLKEAFWAPLTLAIGIGAAIGAMALKYVPADVFKTFLGLAFLFGAFWFAMKRRGALDFASPPEKARGADLAVAAGSGFLGGFVGVNAAPLVMYFGSFLDKQHMRRLFVLIFTGSTITQTATFLLNGMLTREAVDAIYSRLSGNGWHGAESSSGSANPRTRGDCHPSNRRSMPTVSRRLCSSAARRMTMQRSRVVKERVC